MERNPKIVEFGREYLESILTQEAAIKKSSENLDWDVDAKEMVDFITAKGAEHGVK